MDHRAKQDAQVLAKHWHGVTEAPRKDAPGRGEVGQLQIEAQLQEQAEEGVYTRVPVLDGRTPIEAVADPDGRERVEALLEGFERQSEIAARAAIVRPDVRVLRHLLKLFR